MRRFHHIITPLQAPGEVKKLVREMKELATAFRGLATQGAYRNRDVVRVAAESLIVLPTTVLTRGLLVASRTVLRYALCVADDWHYIPTPLV